MTLDGDASNNTSTSDNVVSMPPVTHEVCPFRKGSTAKRVGPILLLLSNFYLFSLYQALEKRPEVRLIEYADVPRMTICPLLFYAQELAAKRFKKLKPSFSASGVGSNGAFLSALFKSRSIIDG